MGAKPISGWNSESMDTEIKTETLPFVATTRLNNLINGKLTTFVTAVIDS
jgi:hypothetical protein